MKFLVCAHTIAQRLHFFLNFLDDFHFLSLNMSMSYSHHTSIALPTNTTTSMVSVCWACYCVCVQACAYVFVYVWWVRVSWCTLPMHIKYVLLWKFWRFGCLYMSIGCCLRVRFAQTCTNHIHWPLFHSFARYPHSPRYLLHFRLYRFFFHIWTRLILAVLLMLTNVVVWFDVLTEKAKQTWIIYSTQSYNFWMPNYYVEFAIRTNVSSFFFFSHYWIQQKSLYIYEIVECVMSWV